MCRRPWLPVLLPASGGVVWPRPCREAAPHTPSRATHGCLHRCSSTTRWLVFDSFLTCNRVPSVCLDLCSMQDALCCPLHSQHTRHDLNAFHDVDPNHRTSTARQQLDTTSQQPSTHRFACPGRPQPHHCQHPPPSHCTVSHRPQTPAPPTDTQAHPLTPGQQLPQRPQRACSARPPDPQHPPQTGRRQVPPMWWVKEPLADGRRRCCCCCSTRQRCRCRRCCC